MKKQVIRVGDQVQVIKNLIVKRVGYPLVWHEIADDVAKEERTALAWRILYGEGPVMWDEIRPPLEGAFSLTHGHNRELPHWFVQAAAKVRVDSRAFGGQERSIHYWPQPEPGEIWINGRCGPNLLDQVLRVEGKRVAKTGTRFPAKGGVYYTQDGPDYWEESGGLENEKTHVLLMLSGGWEIEECNVMLVKRA